MAADEKIGQEWQATGDDEGCDCERVVQVRVVFATHGTNRWLGVNKYFYLLGKHLAQLGVDVRIIVDTIEGVGAVGEICGDTVRVSWLGPEVTGPVTTVRYCRTIRTYLMECDDFDILHCGHVLPFFYLYERVRRPVVFQPFGNELFTLAGRGLNEWYCRIAQCILRYCAEHAEAVVSEGEFQHEEMKRYYPEVQDFHVLPVGVDTEGITPKQNYDLDGPFAFVAVNSLLPYEGMDELVEAFSRIYRMCNARLIVVGTGREKKRLQKMAMGLPVCFGQGLREDVLQGLYEVADAFVCTTHETDFQMGVLEAMASGLPVLCRDASWVPDSVVRFHKDGSDLAYKMSSLASESASRRAERAQKALEEVQQYSFTQIAEKALEIYTRVLG